MTNPLNPPVEPLVSPSPSWFERVNEFFSDPLTARLSGNIVATVALIGVILLLRWLIVRSIVESNRVPSEHRRRLLASVRNLMIGLLLIGVIIIWGSEIKAVAISVLAVAAAIVLATKELIMCISGSLLRTGSHAFKIGDRIEVNGIRGDVFDTTMLTTTLFEVGPGPNAHQSTGRTIQLPNSMFLSQPVINETATDHYVLHSLIIPLKITEDIAAAEHALINAARAECSGYLDTARKNMEQIGKSQGIEALSVEPRISVHLPDPERVNLMLRFPVPARRKGRVEQAILRRYIATRPKGDAASDTQTDRSPGMGPG
ncbi:MAG: mechanosensitive ion channel family protein [Phycisphaerales bacterium JB050]